MSPLRELNGSDPFMVQVEGFYYLLTTAWTDVEMSRATNLEVE